MLLKIIAIICALIGFVGLIVASRVVVGKLPDNQLTSLFKSSSIPLFVMALVCGIIYIPLSNTGQNVQAKQGSLSSALALALIALTICAALLYAGWAYIWTVR